MSETATAAPAAAPSSAAPAAPIQMEAPKVEAPKAEAVKVETPKAQPQPSTDGWSDEAKAKILEKYKGNTDEIIKAYWHSQKENAKIVKDLKAAANKPAEVKTETKTEYKTQQDVYAYMHRDLLDQGKISDDTLNHMKELGYSQAEIARETQLRSAWITEQKKTAQKYVDADVQELFKFAQAENNLTDGELAYIQEGLNLAITTGDPSYYRVLKIVDDRMKAKSGPAPVQHGTIQGGAPNSDGYNHPKEWKKATSDPRYGADVNYTQMVQQKLAASNTDNWQEIILRGY